VLDDGNQYVYGAGLASMKQGGNWFYYLADGLGSTMAVVDSAGAVQKSYQYDVYGEVTGGSGSLPNEFDFAGQQTDATGLQYLRARYYDSVTGTFLSRDPLASPLPGPPRSLATRRGVQRTPAIRRGCAAGTTSSATGAKQPVPRGASGFRQRERRWASRRSLSTPS